VLPEKRKRTRIRIEIERVITFYTAGQTAPAAPPVSLQSNGLPCPPNHDSERKNHNENDDNS